MKSSKNTTFKAQLIWLIVLPFLVSDALPQAGRIPEGAPPPQKSTPIKESDPANKTELPPEQKAEYRFIPPTIGKTFFDKLNKLAEQGYRLQSIALAGRLKGEVGYCDECFAPHSTLPTQEGGFSDDITLTAIVKKDAENKYQYLGFNAEQAPDLQLRLHSWAKLGFNYFTNVPYILEHEPLTVGEGDAPLQINLPSTELNLILLERKNSDIEKREYKVLTAHAKRLKNAKNTLQAELDGIAGQGFRLSGTLVSFVFERLFSKRNYYLIFEKKELPQKNQTESTDSQSTLPTPIADNSDARAPQKEEYKIVEQSGFTGNSANSIQALGRQGFRLAQINASYAVMYRESNTPTPILYEPVYAFYSKNWSKFLEREDIIYRGAGPNFGNHYFADLLFFEQQPASVSARYQYQTIKLTGDIPQPKVKGQKSGTAKPSTEERVAMFRAMLKEGYAFRDLIYADGATVILERLRK